MRSYAICGLYLVSLLLTIAFSRSAIADEKKAILICSDDEGEHVVEIDYEHGLMTSPGGGDAVKAEITEGTITWRRESAYGTGIATTDCSLNRYTGIMTCHRFSEGVTFYPADYSRRCRVSERKM